MSRSTCTNCGGSGTDTIIITEMCYNCAGTGCRVCSWKGFFEWTEQVTCAICGGSGELDNG